MLNIYLTKSFICCYIPFLLFFLHIWYLPFFHLKLIRRRPSPFLRGIISQQHRPEAALVLQGVDVEVYLESWSFLLFFIQTYWWAEHCQKMRHCCDSCHPRRPNLGIGWRQVVNRNFNSKNKDCQPTMTMKFSSTCYFFEWVSK